MLLFYVGLYGLALFLCFLGLLFAITEKIYKWFTSNAKKSHSSKCFEVTSSCSNHNDINEKLASRSLKGIEEDNLETSLKVLEVSENSYNQEDNENQLSDSDISTPTDEMKTIMNERSIDDNHNEIQLTMDTKSFSERRQERRKRYKAKKGYNLSTTGQFSIDSSLDDYNTSTMKNTMIEELDEAKNASDCPVLSDSNDSQLDYFILETHNMCELINSIEITNLDDGEVDVNDNNNAKNNNDSLDITLKST
ncbi:hypothetical protein EWB00_007902 [Schistosoma japonicum]|uniref:Uncharacterized protein n=1 Tax=Schistosoma japonicum TaxID=6182 RepID=A0A4Z2CSK2_SCHJA|nr:hypothetical protein EWB00_007902 [Schistosoma japonicum]TNN07193.1 hypothetical protein EWB00_007902 [Schistosoma japonicum]